MLIYRIPRELSILNPPSFCPHCNKFLKAWQKIPIVSYLFLQGRCFFCDASVPFRYFSLELLSGFLALPFIFKLIFLPIKAFIEVGISPAELSLNFLNYIFILSFISIGLASAFIDNDTAKIPHALSYTGILLACVYAKFFLGQSFMMILLTLGLCFLLFDAFNHFANKIVYKKHALPICPGAISFRLNFLEKHVSKMYILWLAGLAILFILSKLSYIKILLAYLGASYIVNEIFIDFLAFNLLKDKITFKVLQEKYKYHQSADFFEDKKIDFTNLKNAWGGGDTAFIVLIATFAGLQHCFLSISIAFTLSLIAHFISRKNSKEIRLGPALTFALFVAMILTV